MAANSSSSASSSAPTVAASNSVAVDDATSAATGTSEKQAEKEWKLIRMDVIHYIDKTPVKFLKNLHFAATTTKGYTKTKTGKFQAQIYFKGKTRAIGTFKDEWLAGLTDKLARYKIDEGTLSTILSEESSLARSSTTTTTTSVGDTNQGRTAALATAPMIGSVVKDTIKSSSCNNGREICGETTRSAAFTSNANANVAATVDATAALSLSLDTLVETTVQLINKGVIPTSLSK